MCGSNLINVSRISSKELIIFFLLLFIFYLGLGVHFGGLAKYKSKGNDVYGKECGNSL